MTKARFTEEFKEEAVRQVIERGYTVPDVANRLGVSAQSLYKWVKACAPDEKERYEAEIREVRRENLKPKAELLRVKEDREILKKPPHTSPKTRIEVCVYSTKPGKISSPAYVSNTRYIT